VQGSTGGSSVPPPQDTSETKEKVKIATNKNVNNLYNIFFILSP
jgi:hypothetical protein